MSKLLIKSMELGWVATNVYIVYNQDTKECIVIDPAAKADKISAFIEEEKLKPVAILITHAHVDHILALDELRDKYDIKAYMGEKDVDVISDSYNNCAQYLFKKDIKTKADILVKDGDELNFLGYKFKVIETPGHTHGSVCYYLESEDIMFTGDTLFRSTYGRCDMYSGDFETIKKSIKEKLFVLKDDIVLYPGHNGASTMGYEKHFNSILAD